MYTTGFQSSYVDEKLGVSFDDLEGLSIRQQREIVKQRAAQMHKLQRLKYKYHNQTANLTRPDYRVPRPDFNTINLDGKMSGLD